MDVGLHPTKKSVWEDLPQERDQIWAEARMYWILGEPLFLPKELETLATEQQERHRESSGKEGMILDWLEREVPADWNQKDLSARRMYWGGGTHGGETLVLRDRVCAMEVWAECLGQDPGRMRRSDAIEINGILVNATGWIRDKSSTRYGPYGTQRGFKRLSTI